MTKTEGVLAVADRLVKIIYTPDQAGLDECVTALIDELILFVNRMIKDDYTVDITHELTLLEQAYRSKDYVRLADVVLYEIKPGFAELNLE